jgi:hypothetical protein
MSGFRFRDDEPSSTGTVLGVLVGAVAGFAVGMFVAQRVGGFEGLKSKLRRRGARAGESPRYESAADDEFDDVDDDELEGDEADESLEERVLEAFRNDPVLAERAIDIGSISEGVIELAGWVEDEDEAEHAVTLARGVPGVDTVVNRIALGEEEERLESAARRFRGGDPALNEAHWEGAHVGTGRRRQGNSQELDRHQDPRVDLEDRWQRTDDAIRNSADAVEGLAERRAASKRAVRGDRTGGAAVSPSGVPKADHVAPSRDADVPPTDAG